MSAFARTTATLDVAGRIDRMVARPAKEWGDTALLTASITLAVGGLFAASGMGLVGLEQGSDESLAVAALAFGQAVAGILAAYYPWHTATRIAAGTIAAAAVTVTITGAGGAVAATAGIVGIAATQILREARERVESGTSRPGWAVRTVLRRVIAPTLRDGSIDLGILAELRRAACGGSGEPRPPYLMDRGRRGGRWTWSSYFPDLPTFQTDVRKMLASGAYAVGLSTLERLAAATGQGRSCCAAHRLMSRDLPFTLAEAEAITTLDGEFADILARAAAGRTRPDGKVVALSRDVARKLADSRACPNRWVAALTRHAQSGSRTQDEKSLRTGAALDAIVGRIHDDAQYRAIAEGLAARWDDDLDRLHRTADALAR